VLARVLVEYDWLRASADREFKKALELDPNSGCANDIYGTELASVGRFEEAFRQLNRALQFDPRSAVRHCNLGMALYYSRQYDRAIEELIAASRLEPNYWFAHIFLGLTYQQKKMYEPAVKEFQQLPSEFHDAPVFLALGYALAGRKTEALNIVEQIRKSKSSTVTS
jgi:tetratricopeptide (TPR) repeat protein